jgi:hypothetical protein
VRILLLLLKLVLSLIGVEGTLTIKIFDTIVQIRGVLNSQTMTNSSTPKHNNKEGGLPLALSHYSLRFRNNICTAA